MQEAGELHQTLGESSSPKAPADSAASLNSPGLSFGKSKKRERSDQSTILGKNEQLMEEYTSPQKRECVENFVDDGGGLADIAAVNQLILKMKQENSSTLQRSIAANILAATSKGDCLQKFVLSGGVAILEEWIQEGSKIRSSATGLKDGDKGLDEEMLVILQALEKLPISLETLKGCSIGKSVKQLRSVRNGEIQKRARKLVDTWRKRVDFEMKQGSMLPGVAMERAQHLDSMSCASDPCPGKAVEAPDSMDVKSGSPHSQEVNADIEAQTLASTLSNVSTLDASPSDVKTVIPSEKDAIKQTARLSASSTTSSATLSPVKRQKHSATLTMDKDCNDEASNLPDCQKLKEKDLKCEISSSNAASDTPVRKTNEYRKKLRSGGSSAAPYSTDLHAIASPSNVAQSMDEKAMCIDSNMGDSEQHHSELPNRCVDMKRGSTPAGNEVPEPPGIHSDRDAANKGETGIELRPQDAKTDHFNESCLSSQSSCSDKRNLSCPKVFLMVGKMSSPTRPPQGDAKLCSVSNPPSDPANDLLDGKEGLAHLSTKSMSSENDYPDEFIHKVAPKAEPHPSSGSMANVISERNELANVTPVREVGAVDLEESCCSHNTQQCGQIGSAATQNDKNVPQIPAEYPHSHLVVHGAVGRFNGAACSESTKVVVNACQALEKENIAVASFHSCINNASKRALSPSLAANQVNNSIGELDRAHSRASEISAVTHSCHDFDLNEGLVMDDFLHDTQLPCGPSSTSTFSVVLKGTATLSAPIAVSAASKGAFIPPLNAMCKSDIGWTGSAATSAFRPAEPRHASAKPQPILASSTNEARNVNSFDLNVADQDNVEDCLPLSHEGMQEAHLDLNYGGKEIQTRVSAISVSETSIHLPISSLGKLTEKRAVFDFDLNEQLDEVQQEQEVLLTSAAGSYGGPIPFGGLSGRANCGDVASWRSAEGSMYSGASANGPRIELFCSGSVSQPAFSSRQGTPTAILPPHLSSVVYSQTPPFLGGPPPTPFPASFTYNSMPVGPADTSFLVSRSMPGTTASSVGVRSRAEISARPAFYTNIDDIRGNGLYPWGRAPPNMYGNSGATIISYNDAPVGGREHFVNFDGNVSLEEQMRVFQQAAGPVTSLKRRDPEYFSGLKQTTWH